MKILYICGYKNGITGGVQSVVPQYFEALSKFVEVFVYSYGNYQYNHQDKYIQWHSKKELYRNLRKIDVVVFHEVYYIVFYGLADILDKYNIPYLVIPHCSLTTGAQKQKKWIKTIFNYKWVNKFINNAYAVQYLTEFEYTESQKFGDKHIIIPNGICRMKLPAKKYDYKKNLEICFIGRYDIYQKGLDILLEGCKLFRDCSSIESIHISLYGTDFLNGKKYLLQKVKEYQLQSLISIKGSIYGEKKIKVLQESDVFILTSRFEGQPMGVLEAMEVGLPVLVTPQTSFKDIVEKEACGWCVELDAKAIAEILLFIQKEDKEELSTMSENAIKTVEKYFLWDRVAKHTYVIYSKIAGNKEV